MAGLDLIRHKAGCPIRASDIIMHRMMSPVMTVPEQIRPTSRHLAPCIAVALCAVAAAAVAWPLPAAARGSFSLHTPWSNTLAQATAARPVRASQVVVRQHSAGR